MSKLSMLAAGAVGYVLGARAGRERYDQISKQFRRFFTHPRVRQKAADAAGIIKQRAPAMGSHIADTAKATAAKVSGSSDTTSSSSDAGPTSGTNSTQASTTTGAAS